ncbi:hypothetical protein [Thalassotalea maritima]|uniref:hypothetical protein n=1 Tax=Thalassotalea maritima TaxID=3242416 RepID=UPI00352885CB
MKYFLILTVFLLSGCSTQNFGNYVAEKVFEKITNTEISHVGASCPNIKRRCSNGNYEEWYQQNGQKACACNN